MMRRGFLATLATLSLALVPAIAAAQTGSIAGVVKDTTGAVLPGVTVEASSPALIEGTRSVTTDDKGQYKIVDLRPGVYTVTFTLAGFNIIKREGIELTTGFTAPVNADLKVGAITETVTVTGESPIVDTQRVTQQNVMTRDIIAKDGGNAFKGTFFLNGANNNFQSNNLTQALMDQGLRAVNKTKRVWDVSGSLGGPILKNKLWFLVASRYWGLDKYPADSFYDTSTRDFSFVPDSTRLGVDDSLNLSNAVRVTWQATARNKFTGYVDLQDRLTGHWFVGQGGIFGLTAPEASWQQKTPIGHLWQTKWTSTVSSKMLLEAGVSQYVQQYTRYPQPDVTPTTFSILDNSTGRRINSAPYFSDHWSTVRAISASMSYVTGSHAMKVGMNMSGGPRHENAWGKNHKTLRFNAGNPGQAPLPGPPRDAYERLNADLGLYP